MSHATSPRVATRTTLGRRWLRFTWHFLGMLVAMYVGMLTLCIAC